MQVLKTQSLDLLETAAPELASSELLPCSRGQVSPAVLRIRALLARWGISEGGQSSECFDEDLEQAVKRFQYQVFLREDGIVGDLTWRALQTGAPVNMPLLMQGSCCPAVVTLQRRLQLTGDYLGLVDGEFGPLTDQGVRNFQRRQGLAVDGFVTYRIWYTLSQVKEAHRS